MAQKRRRKTRRRGNRVVLSGHVIGAVYIIFSVLGFLNLGYLGTLMVNVLRLGVGDTYKAGFILLAVLGVCLLLRGESPKIDPKKAAGLFIGWSGLLVMLSALFFSRLDLHARFVSITWQYLAADLVSSTAGTAVGGGLIGSLLYTLTYFLVSQLGSYLAADILMFIGICMLLGCSVQDLIEAFGRRSYSVVLFLENAVAKVASGLKKLLPAFCGLRKKGAEVFGEYMHDDSEPGEDGGDDVEEEVPLSGDSGDSAGEVLVEVSEPVPSPADDDGEDDDNDESDFAESTPVDSNYQLPPPDLLTDGQDTDQSSEQAVIRKNRKILIQTLESFGVKAELKNVMLGPAVTRYELHPAIGVKVSKIVNLTDDLALALAAKDIRIEAPIPGKPLIGIEVPNQNVATVAYKTIITEFRKQKGKRKPLEVPLGHNVSGMLETADLAKMPHLLIAGSTGSGKSVAINVIITSLLMNCRPETVRLMMVDPKKVELGIYKDIPHLLVPVITEPRKAARSLEKVVARMEERYERFAENDVRNITGYNQLIERRNVSEGTKVPGMPYIVVVVDELADLMMTTGGSVQDQIVRIAQMGRAAGIHMILATQRPSVDVITGLIKANVPSRMAFAVSSGTDSRTILDGNGAEKLLGRGDMLFMPVGQNKPVRIQGAFISDGDVANVVDFVARQRSTAFDRTMEVTDEEIEQEDHSDDVDELFDDVVKFIAAEGKCSISMLQRHFSIGYNRSARIVDELEARGMIGRQEGARPREVYVGKNE